MKALQNLFVNEQAQGLTEYGLVLGVIAVGVLGIIAGLTENIATMLTNTVQVLTGTDS